MHARPLAIFAITLLSLSPALSYASDTTAQHSKSWYVAHAPERSAALKRCYSNTRYETHPDCQNAEEAVAAALGSSAPLSPLDQPSYWAANPIARNGILRQCADGTIGINRRYCGPARAGGR